MQSTADEHDMLGRVAEPGAVTGPADRDDPGPAPSRLRALEWADAARVVRHQVREQLSDGDTTLVDVLRRAHADELVGQVKLLWALESVPGARKVDTRRTLGALGIAEGTRLGTLDDATTARLIAAFDTSGRESGEVAR